MASARAALPASAWRACELGPRRNEKSVIRLAIAIGLIASAIGATSMAAKADDLPAIRLFAAGSLQAALGEVAKRFTAAEKIRVETRFGPSGVLRDRLDKGEPGDLFASADMGNPLALARAGNAGPVVLFARNRLCAMVRPGLDVTSATLLAFMLDPAVKLGTSTPRADPAGDYAWAMFARADAVRAGSRAALEGKAISLMSGANSARPPEGVNLFAWHLREGHADIFIACCSAGQDFGAQLPGGKLVSLPPSLATGADYGLTMLNGASAGAARLRFRRAAPRRGCALSGGPAGSAQPAMGRQVGRAIGEGQPQCSGNRAEQLPQRVQPVGAAAVSHPVLRCPVFLLRHDAAPCQPVTASSVENPAQRCEARHTR
jgi:molybdate transport system substrate-binding protein